MRTTNLIKAAVIAIFTLPVAVHAQTVKQAPKQCLAPNTPVGTPRGIHPGRVAWSHAPGAATWDGSKASAWFDDSCNDYALCRWLVATTLRNLTGEKSEKRAWRAVFTYFNTQRGKQGKSYGKGEKIAIKVNNNNTYSHEDSREINASPQMLLALLGQVQALVCCVGDVALGIQCVSPAAFVLAGMVESLVYVFVVYALAVALKHVGKALSVLLVVLQIPGASGLYPIQMQPDFFRALGPWLPFTYGINAMREAVAGFYDGYYARNLLVLLAFALPALLLGVAARRRLAGVNALFDRRMAQTDLLIADHPAAWGEKDEGLLASVVDALATSPGHREAFLARAARFELAYPRLVRRGVAALLAVPLVLLALLFVTPAKFALLVLWVLSLVAASAYLIGVEYAHDRLARMSELERMGTDELVGLVEDMRGGDGR